MKELKLSLKRNSTISVDLSALKHNLAVIRNKVGSGTKLMPVVKANAYGHGSSEVANVLQDEVDWFAVNSVQEGIELRDSGINLPILVFGVPDFESAKLYSEYSLTATISSMEHFGLLPAGTEYHLNFNTGMGRLGIGINDVDKIMSEMDSHTELICTGIYSHFATSHKPGSSLVKLQLQRFKKVRESFPENLVAHISNTGGALFYEHTSFDMIRPGIGIYGYPPGDTNLEDLRPALRWYSRLVQVNPITKGESVSYGAQWQAPEDGFIGVIPIGYEDGLKRSLSGSISFQIGEQLYPQVGTITMNYCMIYLGDKKLPEGAEVQVIRSSQKDVENWAAKIGSIPYEILTSLSPKIPRVYKS